MKENLILILGFTVSVGSNVALFLYVSGRIDRMGERIDHMSDQLTSRIDRISDDLGQFYRTLGQHDKAIEILEKQRGQSGA